MVSLLLEYHADVNIKAKYKNGSKTAHAIVISGSHRASRRSVRCVGAAVPPPERTVKYYRSLVAPSLPQIGHVKELELEPQ